MKTMKFWKKSRLSECHANLFANGRTGAIYVIPFVMLAVFSLASCSSNDSEQEKPFIVCPEEQIKFFACETSSETRGATAVIDTLFTEDDIEWFNVSTREIRFKKQGELLYMKLKKNYHKEGLEFRIGEDEGNPRYYLHDCYPAQFINDERTQANIKKNAVQWETFTKYLESKGKLRK